MTACTAGREKTANEQLFACQRFKRGWMMPSLPGHAAPRRVTTKASSPTLLFHPASKGAAGEPCESNGANQLLRLPLAMREQRYQSMVATSTIVSIWQCSAHLSCPFGGRGGGARSAACAPTPLGCTPATPAHSPPPAGRTQRSAGARSQRQGGPPCPEDRQRPATSFTTLPRSLTRSCISREPTGLTSQVSSPSLTTPLACRCFKTSPRPSCSSSNAWTVHLCEGGSGATSLAINFLSP